MRTVQVLDDKAIVRSAPSSTSEAVAELHANDEITLGATIQRQRSTWVEVTLPTGIRGYVPGGVGIFEPRDGLLGQSSVSLLDSPTEDAKIKTTYKEGDRFTLLRVVTSARKKYVEVRSDSGEVGFIPGDTKVAHLKVTPEILAGPADQLKAAFGEDVWYEGKTGVLHVGGPCWSCGKEPPVGRGTRCDLYFHRERRTRWTAVEIPRCARCKRVHRWTGFGTVSIPLAFLVGLICMMIAFEKDIVPWWFVAILLGFFLGSIGFGTAILPIIVEKTTGIRPGWGEGCGPPTSHPILQRLLHDGWSTQIASPAATTTTQPEVPRTPTTQELDFETIFVVGISAAAKLFLVERTLGHLQKIDDIVSTVLEDLNLRPTTESLQHIRITAASLATDRSGFIERIADRFQNGDKQISRQELGEAVRISEIEMQRYLDSIKTSG